MVFSRASKGSTSPRRCRSSGTCATPSRRMRALSARRPPSMVRPARVSRPSCIGVIPASTSRSTDWPLPETPATPSTSPARSSNETASSRAVPAPSRQVRSSTLSATAPGSPFSRSGSSTTSCPTISSASCSRVVRDGFRCPTILPDRITETVSQTAMTSASLWVMSRIVTPLSRRPRRISKSRSVSAGVSTLVGSSRIRMRAPRRSALRISTRCCSPTGRSPTMASGSTCKP